MLVRTDTGPATPVGRYSCQSLVEPTPTYLFTRLVAFVGVALLCVGLGQS